VEKLGIQDFTVLDNKIPQKVTSFSALGGSGAPVEVVVVLDAINAPFFAVASERDQIKKYLKAHGERLTHPTSVALLTESGMQIQPTPSTDGIALSKVLDDYTVRLRTLRRSTGFYGAEERLNLSLNLLDQFASQEAAKPGRKLVLWASPGWPLLTGPNVQLGRQQHERIFSTIVETSDALRSARITLYAIDGWGATEPLLRSTYYKNFVNGVTKPSDSVLGNLGLQVLAEQTGGRAVRSNDLGVMLDQCLTDTNLYYELAYDPPPADHPNEYHRIDVQLAKPNLTARTLQGYYQQP
jgi:VWFA-related protein